MHTPWSQVAVSAETFISGKGRKTTSVEVVVEFSTQLFFVWKKVTGPATCKMHATSQHTRPGANPGSGLKLFADSVKVEREAKATTRNKVACLGLGARKRN